LNIPFGESQSRLLVALVAGLTGLGLIPRTVLEVHGSRDRLSRIFGPIQACRYSIHDLSFVQLEKKAPRCPRFNMPFELGLAVSWTMLNPTEHNWYVLETRPLRILKSLSDLNGFEPFIRGYGVDGALRALTDIFLRSAEQRSARELKRLYRSLNQQVPTIKKRSGSKTLFAPRAIQELVLAGQAAATVAS
jgi:hypothetical protein